MYLVEHSCLFHSAPFRENIPEESEVTENKIPRIPVSLLPVIVFWLSCDLNFAPPTPSLHSLLFLSRDVSVGLGDGRLPAHGFNLAKTFPLLSSQFLYLLFFSFFLGDIWYSAHFLLMHYLFFSLLLWIIAELQERHQGFKQRFGPLYAVWFFMPLLHF